MVPEYYAKDRAAWRKWLVENHDKEQAVWLVYDKGAGRTLRWEEIVQEALCFGWIDGLAGTVSDTQSKIRVTRRKPRSNWSRINKEHVEQLIAEGLMTPAGLAAIEVAKRNGSWDSLNRSDNLEVPAELQRALDDDNEAGANWSSWSESRRRILLGWIYAAKRPETTAKRVAEAARLAKHNLKFGE
ncbi:MAG: hypothetical protein K0S68_326 [Candidatus Saccharibacteria bacterium]|nr:hypothetical protein [Candidatus Saccharibacteria bacterium]